jgi:hypothetical protein
LQWLPEETDVVEAAEALREVEVIQEEEPVAAFVEVAHQGVVEVVVLIVDEEEVVALIAEVDEVVVAMTEEEAEVEAEEASIVAVGVATEVVVVGLEAVSVAGAVVSVVNLLGTDFTSVPK